MTMVVVRAGNGYGAGQVNRPGRLCGDNNVLSAAWASAIGGWPVGECLLCTQTPDPADFAACAPSVMQVGDKRLSTAAGHLPFVGEFLGGANAQEFIGSGVAGNALREYVKRLA